VQADSRGIATGYEDWLPLPADKVLRISQTMVEFAYHGFLPISAEVEVFQHWEGEIHNIPLDAVKVGFEEVIATVFQGEIVRFDVHDPLYIRTMRVAISTDQFRSIEHERLSFSSTTTLYVEEKGTGRAFSIGSDQEVVLFVANGRLQVIDGQGSTWEFAERLHIWSDRDGLVQINSFKRGSGTQFYPRYRGRFEITAADNGRFLVINEVNMEDYLYQVVPSEMPISWPLEALKAQAVAARTYAVAQAIYSRQGHLGFHVADSTNSQVYNNHPEASRTTQAIDETVGQILAQADGTISSTYFFSTSPRMILTDLNTWKDTSALALEGNSPWFRWSCTFTKEELENIFKIGEISAVEIAARDEVGRVFCLLVSGLEGEKSIEGELNIRRALTPPGLRRVNDSLGPQSLLPSALFFLEEQRDAGGKLQLITIYGGGSGHNLGMSQWGAKGMAETGCDHLHILEKYYPDATLITHSQQLRY
jgi:stage II sporulation protein D